MGQRQEGGKGEEDHFRFGVERVALDGATRDPRARRMTMDSSQRDIPIVEDDMGEGFKDPIEERENLLDRLQREAWKSEERLRRKGAMPK